MDIKKILKNAMLGMRFAGFTSITEEDLEAYREFMRGE